MEEWCLHTKEAVDRAKAGGRRATAVAALHGAHEGTEGAQQSLDGGEGGSDAVLAASAPAVEQPNDGVADVHRRGEKRVGTKQTVQDVAEATVQTQDIPAVPRLPSTAVGLPARRGRMSVRTLLAGSDPARQPPKTVGPSPPSGPEVSAVVGTSKPLNVCTFSTSAAEAWFWGRALAAAVSFFVQVMKLSALVTTAALELV
ncbi:hypothetical protein C8R47DRAFT_1162290 [Mycena vitilis]|nr:hypothetical protein C8R47DRAFT_1162290 [Mycena vitilis]